MHALKSNQVEPSQTPGRLVDGPINLYLLRRILTL